VDMSDNKVNDGSFIVRAPKKDIAAFNKAVQDNAVNRAELFRMWMKEYVRDNEKKGGD